VLKAYYDYHEWATGRLIRLCDGLSDQELDAPRDIGLGSLRATLFHILAAENFWKKRWKGEPTGAFPLDPKGISLAELELGFAESAEIRRRFMELESKTDYGRLVKYVHANGAQYEQQIGDLLLHVCNHAIHHRAQALNILKGFGRTIPGGLDYSFYKIARPSTPQRPESNAAMREYGLETEGPPSAQVPWEKNRVQDYFAYGDWALTQLLESTRKLPAEKLAAWLDTSFNMGVGAPRKAFLHLLDAERWWYRNWTMGPSDAEELPSTTSLEDFEALWRENALRRNAFIAQQDALNAQRVITAKVHDLLIDLRAVESMLQLCCHGTHHRAQILNMLRQSGAELPKIDYVVWLRLQNA
jgi:uncharacterized damage-inducible protein DinB